MKNRYHSLELFAGAGGLALGLEQAGFSHVGLVEIDKNSVETLKKNRPNWNVIHEDIIKFIDNGLENYLDINNIDLVSGGFPCQPFSYAGNKLGLKDTRGNLFYFFAKVIKKVQPKIFLAENVRGLLNHDKGKTFKLMLKEFELLGYKLYWQILNAVDYGVPQKRQRLILIGIKNNLWIKDFIFPKRNDNIITLKEGLKDVPESLGARYSEKKKQILSLVRPGGCWKDLPAEIAKMYMGKSYFLGGGKTGIARRLSWDEPSLTLTCSPVQMQTERCHPEETRPFTIREYARIQSFPDDWEFVGSISSSYKQIGNAVPVNLAKKVGVEIIKYLDDMKEAI